MKHSVLPSVFLFFLTLSCVLVAQENGDQRQTPPQVAPQDKSETPEVSDGDMQALKIQVVDPDGNSIENADVAFRADFALPGGGYIPQARLGFDNSKATDEFGFVTVRVAKTDGDSELKEVTVRVRHAEFITTGELMAAADEGTFKVVLDKGFRIAIGVVDEAGEKLTEGIFAMSSFARTNEWQQKDNGLLISPIFPSQLTKLRVVQVVEGKPTLFSKEFEIDAKTRSRVLLKDIKLLSGVRVEGKLDASVPRPVRNGVVSVEIKSEVGADVRNKGWHEVSEINEDGTFVLESLPRDTVAQFFVCCDGWIGQNPSQDAVMESFPNEIKALDGHAWVPQLIGIKDVKLAPTIAMQKLTELTVKVQNAKREPIKGVAVRAVSKRKVFGRRIGFATRVGSSRSFLASGGFVGSSRIFLSDVGETNANGEVVLKGLPQVREVMVFAMSPRGEVFMQESLKVDGGTLIVELEGQAKLSLQLGGF